MSLPICPVCPTDCSTAVLGAVAFDNCNPAFVDAQIDHVYICADLEEPLADWTDAAEWATRISQTGTGADAVRDLLGIGSVAEPDITTTERAGGLIDKSAGKYTLQFEIDQASANNHSFIQKLACNTSVLLLGFSVTGGKMFGYEEGITAKVQKCSPVISNSKTDVIKYVLELVWESNCAYSMIPNPLA